MSCDGMRVRGPVSVVCRNFVTGVLSKPARIFDFVRIAAAGLARHGNAKEEVGIVPITLRSASEIDHKSTAPMSCCVSRPLPML